MTLHWPAEAIWEAVAPLLPDFTVEVLPCIDSTNSELMRRARSGLLEPVLLVAETQTAGRGRLGRQWLSAAGPEQGNSLTFSLGLPLRCPDWSGLSLAVGVAVAQSLHPEIQLKWPNDLWWQERKLAGILIETVDIHGVRFGVIGIGLNIAPPQEAGLTPQAAGLQEVLPGVTAPLALQRLVPPLCQALRCFEAEGFAPFRPEFLRRDGLLERLVRLSDGTTGTARGVDARGALLVHTSSGLLAVHGSEVSVRPQTEKF